MMAHGLNSVIKRSVTSSSCKSEGKGIGSRRIFAPHFKLQVLDSYRNDGDCKGNQRATARKYGIHRRQIQKWLQVENILRNSVSKEKSECLQVENIIRSCISKEKSDCATETKLCEFELTLNVNRQRDDDMFSSGVEARVPALTQSPLAPPFAPLRPLPLDFTTHSRSSDHTSPNVARSESPRSPLDHATPIDLSFKRPTSTSMTSAPVVSAVPLTPSAAPETGQCVYLPMSNSPPSDQHYPDIWDLSTKSLKRKSPSPMPVISPKPVKLFKPYLDDNKEPEEVKEPPCCSAVLSSCETIYCNNVCDIKSDYNNSYTLHELQPNSAINYYYYPPYTSNTDYECNGYCCEDISYGQNVAPLKHRQSYSLDFKLSAINCYYQDSICKGNQRAVAFKYNIHRRQIQKWLKQAEELRIRNESMKQIHAVR